MPILSKISVVLVLFMCVCCSETNNEKNEKAKQDSFFQYLEETFNLKDYIEEKMFIIIPCSGCSGCEELTFSIFLEKLVDIDDFMLIICNPAQKGLLLPRINASNIKYDFMAKMSDYYFGYGYPTCIVIKDNKVIENYTLSPDVLHWINKFNSKMPSFKDSTFNTRQ